MYDCLTLVPKETFKKDYHREPVGSTSDHLTLVLDKIHRVRAQNNIAAIIKLFNVPVE